MGRTPHEIAAIYLVRAAGQGKPCGLAALQAGPVFAALLTNRRIAMTPFFVQIKCELGKSYQVANELAEAEIASEI
jgi:hypothetical protein